MHHINKSTTNDHRYLKTKAENILYSEDTLLDDHIIAHIEIRQKMIAACYSAIADKESTASLVIMGLQKYSALSLIIGKLVASEPATDKKLKSKFKFLHNAYQPIHGPTLPQPPQPSAPKLTVDCMYQHPYRQFLDVSSVHRVVDYFRIKNSVKSTLYLECQLSSST